LEPDPEPDPEPEPDRAPARERERGNDADAEGVVVLAFGPAFVRLLVSDGLGGGGMRFRRVGRWRVKRAPQRPAPMAGAWTVTDLAPLQKGEQQLHRPINRNRPRPAQPAGTHWGQP
jgi:hypothetical protein